MRSCPSAFRRVLPLVLVLVTMLPASARWTHFAPAQAASGDALRLSFDQPEGGEAPLEAWLHASLDGLPLTPQSAIELGGDRLVFELPPSLLSGGRLDYFVELVVPGGRMRLPAAGAWRVALAPEQQLQLVESLSDLRAQEPGQVLLAFAPLDERVDLATARLWIDDQPAEGAIADAWLLTWSGELSGGAHRLRLELRDREGRALPSQSFALAVRDPGRTPAGYTADAWQEFNMDFQQGRGEEWSRHHQQGRGEEWSRHHAAQLRLRAWHGEGRRSWQLAGRALLAGQDFESEAVLQPQSRLELELRRGGFRLGLGDRQPDFGEAILSGTRVRGGELGWQGRGFGVEVVSGVSRKALDPVFGWRTNAVGDTLLERRFAGSYERRLHGLDLRFGPRGRGEFGLSLLKVKDEVTSIQPAPSLWWGSPAAGRLSPWAAAGDTLPGITPQDNVVTALRLNLSAFQGRLSLRNQAAFSLANTDIRRGAIADSTLDSLGAGDLFLSPEDFEDLIVINEYFTPLNLADGDVLTSSALISNWALQVPGNDLLLEFRRIGPSFQSLGNAFLRGDRQSWRVTDRLRLADNEIYIEAALHGSRDNLDGQYDASVGRTAVLGAGMALGWYPRAHDLRGRLGFEQLAEENQAEERAPRIGPASSPADRAAWESQMIQRVRGTTRQLSLGLGGGLDWLNRRHEWNLSLLWQLYDDKIGRFSIHPDTPPRFDRGQTTQQISLDWAAPLAARTNLRLGLGWHTTDMTDDDQFASSYLSLRGALSRSWFDGRLASSLRARLQNVASDEPGGDYLRSDLGLQADWKIRAGLDLAARCEWQGYSGDRGGDYLRTVLRLSQSF
jgi:hypothetical protein